MSELNVDAKINKLVVNVRITDVVYDAHKDKLMVVYQEYVPVMQYTPKEIVIRDVKINSQYTDDLRYMDRHRLELCKIMRGSQWNPLEHDLDIEAFKFFYVGDIQVINIDQFPMLHGKPNSTDDHRTNMIGNLRDSKNEDGSWMMDAVGNFSRLGEFVGLKEGTDGYDYVVTKDLMCSYYAFRIPCVLTDRIKTAINKED